MDCSCWSIDFAVKKYLTLLENSLGQSLDSFELV